MGCRSDHLEASEAEKESRLVAELIAHVLSFPQYRRVEVPEGLGDAIKNYYGNKDRLHEWTAMLCDMLKKMNAEDLDKIVYNGRDPTARKLADWQDKHNELDRKRRAEEDAAAKKKRLIHSALNKLTNDEKKALGLNLKA